MSVISHIKNIFTIDRPAQRKRVVKNCVDLLFESYIGKDKISPLETSLALNEIRKEVFERLVKTRKLKESEIEALTFSLQNIEYNDTAK
jgi:hypothetical protein